MAKINTMTTMAIAIAIATATAKMASCSYCGDTSSGTSTSNKASIISLNTIPSCGTNYWSASASTEYGNDFRMPLPLCNDSYRTTLASLDCHCRLAAALTTYMGLLWLLSLLSLVGLLVIVVVLKILQAISMLPHNIVMSLYCHCNGTLTTMATDDTMTTWATATTIDIAKKMRRSCCCGDTSSSACTTAKRRYDCHCH